VLAVRVRILLLLKKKQDVNRSKQDTLRTFQKERCQPLIGLINLNGKESNMPQGKGTYGSKVGRPPKKKAAPKAKKPVKRITQEEVEARIRDANKREKNMTPSPAMQKKMAEQMRNKKMDAKMKAAVKRVKSGKGKK
jgi:cell pole-organizing protein PopZ